MCSETPSCDRSPSVTDLAHMPVARHIQVSLAQSAANDTPCKTSNFLQLCSAHGNFPVHLGGSDLQDNKTVIHAQLHPCTRASLRVQGYGVNGGLLGLLLHLQSRESQLATHHTAHDMQEVNTVVMMIVGFISALGSSLK